MEVRLKLQDEEKGEFQFAYTLIIDEEFAVFLGYPEKPTCQHCKSPIMEMPFYYCRETKKVFCRDCVYGKENICIPERHQENHPHYRIMKLQVKGGNNKRIEKEIEIEIKDTKFTDDGFEIV